MLYIDCALAGFDNKTIKEGNIVGITRVMKICTKGGTRLYNSSNLQVKF
jgi:hypothetical protein